MEAFRHAGAKVWNSPDFFLRQGADPFRVAKSGSQRFGGFQPDMTDAESEQETFHAVPLGLFNSTEQIVGRLHPPTFQTFKFIPVLLQFE